MLTETVQSYFKSSLFAPVKLGDKTLWKRFEVNGNVLLINRKLALNSYVAADLAEFIRGEVLKAGLSFSFETVMSDARKIDFLESAKEAGYKIYLYYFCTQNPKININRVKLRVAQSGHDVDAKVIENRYYKSLANLKKAIMSSYRAYVFDNSQVSELIAEIDQNRNVEIVDDNNT